MKVICAGAGEVNFKVAEQLISEGHSVTFLDKDEKAIQSVSEELDVMTVVGDVKSVKSLKEAGCDDADIMIASASDDEDNILACSLSDEMGVPLKIAKVCNSEYLENKESREILKNRGVDFVVNPYKSIADEIENIIRYRFAFETKNFDEEVLLVAFRATDESLLLHHRVREINEKKRLKISMIVDRKSNSSIPEPNRRIKYNDLIYFFTLRKNFPYVYETFMNEKFSDLKKILVLGGDLFTNIILSERFSKSNFDLTFIESEKDKARQLAEKVKNLVVFQENINLIFLSSDMILNADAIIVQSGSDKIRVATAMIAKKFGGKCVITSFKKMRNPEPYLKLGLDGVFNSNLTISNSILTNIYNHEINKIGLLHSGYGQCFWLKVREDSKFIDVSVSELRKKSIGLGVIKRDEEYFFPGDEEQIMQDDDLFLIDLSNKGENVKSYLSKNRFKF